MFILYIDGSVQDCCISSALALEIQQSCTEPSIYEQEIIISTPYLWFQTHLLESFALVETFHAIFNQEETDTMSRGLGFGVCDSYDNDDIGHPAVCDEDLAAVDDVIITVFNGVCFDTLKVTERIRSHANQVSK